MQRLSASAARPHDPRGFGGQVPCLSALVPHAGRILHVPDGGRREGPFLHLPDGPFDGAVVSGLPGSLGALPEFFAALRARLVEGAPLVVDAANAQSLVALRAGLEGRPRRVEPVGDPRDPDRPVQRADLLRWLADAGFLVHDVFEVSAPGDPVVPEFPAALLAQGILPFALRGGPPPRRFWLTASARAALPGSILIGPGDADAVARTRACLAFLPEGCEVVECRGENEASAFAAGVAEAAGEWLWFLRAGSTVDAAAFAALHGRLLAAAAAVPARAGAPVAPGDLSGLLVWRTTALAIGSFAYPYSCPAIAYEDFLLALDAAAGEPAPAETHGFATPPAPRAVDGVAEEARDLVERWQRLGLTHGHDPRARRDVPPPPWAGREPRLSLVMMVKDEARTLARCLRSVRDAVDEIIVVDTGSSDETVEIARSFDARVLHCAWTDDFSAPRNVGLAAATGDWILVLDADEAVRAGDAPRLRELIADPTVSGWQLVLQNEYGDGTKTLGVAILRLFRNLPGIRYQNRIHEQVLPTLQAEGARLGLRVQAADVVVLHDGYTDECMAARNKNERNERLFRLQLAETPDDIYALYKFGDFLRRVPGRRADALPILERAWRVLRDHPLLPPGELPYAAEIAALLALEYACAERFAEAEAILAVALREFMPTPNLHYIAAGIAAHVGRHHDAIAHYRACLQFAGQVMVVPVQEGVTSYVALAGIAQAYLRLGDRRRAAEWLARARALRPDFEVTALALANLLVQEGEPGRALGVLAEQLGHAPRSAGACQQAAVILARLGHVEQARSMGQRAVALLEEAELRTEAQRARRFVESLG
ncbi:MAG TPA: glycosyltransferase [Planctomycetota bacterium]|nr:glycosyltransferase [Planctomycetota bacterium]